MVNASTGEGTMAFSAGEAAFEGFRVVRRSPMSLVFWSLAYLLFMALMFAAIGGPLIGIMAEAQRIGESGAAATPEDLAPLMTAYMSVLPLLIPISLFFSAILAAAVARAVLRPEQKAFGYLRMGMDEVRVAVVTFVLGVLALVAYMILALVAGVIGGVGAAAMGGEGAAILPGVIAMLVVAVVMIWLFARFSLAVPITVAEKRMAIFDSFKMTKGRTLPIIGMAIVAWVMAMVVALLGFLVCLPIVLAVGGFGRLTEMEGASSMEIAQAFGPVLLVFLVVQALLASLQLAVLYAPFAAAYRDIKGPAPETPAV
jgi:hypothetical protein